MKKELSLTGYFLEQLQALDDTGRHIRIIEKKISPTEMQLFRSRHQKSTMSQVAWQLDNEYGVMTRVGLHCAQTPTRRLVLILPELSGSPLTGKYKE